MKTIKKLPFALITILFLVVLINTKTYATSVPELKNKYPTGMQWNDSYHGWTECAGFAALMYDEYYGLNPITYAPRIKDVSQIKAGDIVRYNGHSVWVTARNGDVLTIAECNYDWNNHVRWDQTRYISNISGSLEYIMQAPWAIGTTPPALGSPASASVDTSNGVEISWSQVAYCTGYQIKIYNSKNELVKDFEAANIGAKSRKVFGLATDSYTVRVYAKRYDELSQNYASASFSCEQEASTYSVSPEHLMVQVGKTGKMKCNLYPTGGNAECYFYNGSRTDTKIATIDSEGNVTGISEGTTYVHFHFKTSQTTVERGTYKVTVVKGISFKENTKTLKPGDTYKVQVTSMPTSYSSLSWSSSSKNIATVDQDGNVTAVGPGTVSIRLNALVYDSDEKNAYTYVSDVCEVTVREPEPDVELTNATDTSTSVNTHTFSSLSETLQLKAKLSNNESTNFTWKSSNEKVLKVDQNGKVTPIAGGFADITVTDSKYGKIAGCRCYVQVPVTLSDGSKAYVGDMDKNGFFNAVDSSMILDAFNNGVSADQYLLGDVNGDGIVNAVDSSLMNDLYVTGEFSPGRYYKITGVTLNKTETIIKKGNTETLKVTINPTNTTDSPKITWSSSNTNIATVDNNGKVTAKSKGTTTITATTTNGKVATCKVTVNSDTPSVKYRTHVQKEGWQNFVEDGATSGTTGKSLRLEGIKIELDSQISGNVEYRTHVQNEGWQDWKKNGELSGTTGKSLRLEAIQMRLTGEIEKQYDIYYRVHAQEFGWMGWTKNGEQSGTQGYGYRLEGIQIKKEKKGENGPTSSVLAFSKNLTVSYSTHVQKEGWQKAVGMGRTSGTTGKGLRLEGIKINLNTNGMSGGIRYSTHIQNEGWQSWKTNGEISGTTGKNLRMEAIKIELTGKVAEQYDIYYRVHAQSFGWMGWAKNGEQAGTQGYSYRLEAIEIRVVKKGAKAPGSIENAFRKK